MSHAVLLRQKMILMARLGDVKKGPAWQRRVAAIQELFEELFGHIRKVEEENDALRRMLGRPKL